MPAVEPFIADPDFTLYVGDALTVLAGLPSESVHCVVTSPPYWGLRDYGTGEWDGGDPACDHRVREDARIESSTLGGGKATTDHQREGFRDVCPRCGARRVDRQLGLEPTPEEYVANMVAVFREVRRVLRRDGTCWLNIGDSYNAHPSGDRPKASLNHGSSQPGYPKGMGQGPVKTLKPKDLVGIPWRLAFALQADGWYLRADIIWSKPNPMPESATDRPTKAHEFLFLLTRSARYFYDADAIREEALWERWGDQTNRKHEGSGSSAGWIGDRPKRELVKNRTVRPGIDVKGGGQGTGQIVLREGQGRNRRSVWEIATQPYPEAHFATFPEALVEPCVKAGTSERGCCPECGAPWERVVERETVREHGGMRAMDKTPLPVVRAGWRKGGPKFSMFGWRPTCECFGHLETIPAIETVPGTDQRYKDEQRVYVWDREPPAPVACTVADIFMGSGTTALVARRLGRRSIGIELNEEYARLALARLSIPDETGAVPKSSDGGQSQMSLLG